jgi:hypothetical protein
MGNMPHPCVRRLIDDHRRRRWYRRKNGGKPIGGRMDSLIPASVFDQWTQGKAQFSAAKVTAFVVRE